MQQIKNFTGKIDSKITTPEEYLSSDFTNASKQISDLSKKATLAQGKRYKISKFV